MRLLKIVVLLWACTTLVSCTEHKPVVSFTFLQVNDVYEISPLEGGTVGGMARVEKLHQDLIAENPNTFLFMAGDFLNPSLIGNIKIQGKRVKGRHMIEVMNAMKFDLVALGNHEFDLNEVAFQERLDQATFQWIATNPMHNTPDGLSRFTVNAKKGNKPLPKEFIFHIQNKEGVAIKIGFISATINSNPKNYVDYGDFYQAAIYANKKLLPKTDVIFGLTHLTIEQDKLLARSLPNIPLIMGGHEHVHMSIPVGDAVITKADANAKTVYIHRITFNTQTKETHIVSELRAINEATGTDKGIDEIVQKWTLLLNTQLEKIMEDPSDVIYTAKIPLDGRDTFIRSEQTNLGDLITKAMAFSFDNKVDGAIVNGGSIRIDDQLQGDITGVDIFRILPFGGSVLKVELKGSLLIKVLNFGRLKSGKGAYLQRFQFDYNKEEKIWMHGLEKIHRTKVYSVAFSEYLLTGNDIPFLNKEAPGVLKIHKNKPTDKASDIRKAIIAYLKSIL
ncbi:MAG: bifunctional metallophosphatase/5'-nucleotidase [Flavobacteriaceae bacterium]|nr:MAG: bifunctional metallophosphatase/5'-nucleotidase [Flavobacteriaceae bacterium]